MPYRAEHRAWSESASKSQCKAYPNIQAHLGDTNHRKRKHAYHIKKAIEEEGSQRNAGTPHQQHKARRHQRCESDKILWALPCR